MPQQTENFIQVAKEAATISGKFLMENLGGISAADVEEKSINSFVTHIDKQSERMIIDHIKKDFPDHAIVAEESGIHKTNSEYRWLIDPLDGTTNFIQALPHFAVSIAVQHKQKTIVGVVLNPNQNEMFYAEIEKGAFLNDNRLTIGEETDFSRAILTTGFPHQLKRHLPRYLPAFQEIMLKCSGIRRWGSAALDLCYTACNRFNGFWELGLSPWDIASGSLIVQEAGGIVTDFWGAGGYLNNGYIIAGNKHIHSQLHQILNFHFKLQVKPKERFMK